VVSLTLWAVPRKLRIEYPGAMYHVLNRGDQRVYDSERRETELAKAQRIISQEIVWLFFLNSAFCPWFYWCSFVVSHRHGVD
jgi:hypothetical protein